MAKKTSELVPKLRKRLEKAKAERIVNGLKIDVIEKKYAARYVGFYDLPSGDGGSRGPFLVFYAENPDREKGHDNYFGIWRHPLTDFDIRIFNAKAIRDAEFAAIQISETEYLVSRYRHDYVTADNGAMLDGGLEYHRYNPKYPITHKMTVVDGYEVFLRLPEKQEVIDAEFEEIKPVVLIFEPNGMSGLLGDVGTFHDACEQPILLTPTIPASERVQLRLDLIEEEWEELQEAVERQNIVAISDALADITYVVVGMALEFGIPLDRVWAEVQRSNMAKVDARTGKVRKRADDKVLKPEGWTPPNIEAALRLV